MNIFIFLNDNLKHRKVNKSFMALISFKNEYHGLVLSSLLIKPKKASSMAAKTRIFFSDIIYNLFLFVRFS